MSGYHSFELAYLATVYTNLLMTKQPMDLYFKPQPGGFKDNILRVAPDILPPGSVYISEVWINGQPYSDFDAESLTVKLPDIQDELKVRVRILPTQVFFNATLLELTDSTAKISLSGLLDANAVQLLQEELEKAMSQPVKRLVLLLQNLKCISSAGLRALIFIKQKLGADVDIYVVGASEHVLHFLNMSAFCEGITVLDHYGTVEMASV
jgi:anti-anti-sigma factor